MHDIKAFFFEMPDVKKGINSLNHILFINYKIRPTKYLYLITLTLNKLKLLSNLAPLYIYILYKILIKKN